MRENDVIFTQINREEDNEKVLYGLKYTINSEEFLETIIVEKHEQFGNMVHVPSSFWKSIEVNHELGSRLNTLIQNWEKGEIVELPYRLGNLSDVHISSNRREQ